MAINTVETPDSTAVIEYISSLDSVQHNRIFSSVMIASGKPMFSELMEDIVQETLFAGYRKRHHYNLTKGTVLTWLFTVMTRHVTPKFYERHFSATYFNDPDREMDLYGNQKEPDDYLWNERYTGLINELLRHCTDKQAEAIRGSLLSHVPQRAYAETKGVTRETVSHNLRDGIKNIKKYLAKNPSILQALEQEARSSISDRMMIVKCPGSGKWTDLQSKP